MKKIIFGIFAHPDDEAFGPCGTLLQEIRNGTDVHLITLTAGENGANPDNHLDLGGVRLEEWHAAGNLLGAKSMHFLGYKDGQLNNLAMIEATGRIATLVTHTLASLPQDIEIEFMGLDLNGYTGHIDHIVATRAACHAFYTFKKNDSRFSRIRLACMPREIVPTTNIDWIYMEPGRTSQEINETVDARTLAGDIRTIMQAHASQRADYETAIKNQGANLGLNYFIVKS
ncbi:MAG: LmbE family protein [Candidatus Saccharibacteria bacterium]|nr:LmbE family protein [Candidatus Saccharibacteria bacterium]